MLAEFASVVDAVRCAGEIHRAMADRDLDLAEERRPALSHPGQQMLPGAAKPSSRTAMLTPSP